MSFYLTVPEKKGIDTAIQAINFDRATKIQVSDRLKVYKIPSNNPNKYTIRIDIQVEK